MKLWLLKYHDGEVENYRISSDPERLKTHVKKLYEKATFTEYGGDVIGVDDGFNELGVIAPVEMI